MKKPNTLYGRDIVGIIIVFGGLILMALGINHLVSGIIIMVVTYYFARRVDGEGEDGKDVHQRVKKLEQEQAQPKTTPSDSNKEKQTIRAHFKPSTKPPVSS